MIDTIERAVQRKFDNLDAMLASGRLFQDEYDEEAKEIGRWADEQYLARDGQYLDR